MNDLKEMQASFSSIDMDTLSACYEAIESDPMEAIEFAKNPDGYLRGKMKGHYTNPSLHFHIQVGDETLPPQQNDISNRIIFYKVVNLPEGLKNNFLEVLGLDAKPLDANELFPRDCMRARCYECNIAIINWVSAS